MTKQEIIKQLTEIGNRVYGRDFVAITRAILLLETL